MSLVTQQITSGSGPILAGSSGGDPLPRDRVTLTSDAIDGTVGSAPIPHGDVRWYRPRGDAMLRRPTLLEWATGSLAAASAGPRRHAGVETYLRTMRLVA